MGITMIMYIYTVNGRKMKWKVLWMSIFGICEWLGLNMVFWVSVAALLLIVNIMNAAFWE